MNKAQKNIVVVGFSEEERNSLALPHIEKNKIHYVDSLSEAIKYQGYLLIIDNKEDIPLVQIDKRYRKSLNKFARIWLYNEKYKWKYDKWSRIERVNQDIFRDVSYSLSEEWEEYTFKKNHEVEVLYFRAEKNVKLLELVRYLKNYKAIKTDDIMVSLKLGKRSIQRYMKDINFLYRSVGYDYAKNEWYFIW